MYRHHYLRVSFRVRTRTLIRTCIRMNRRSLDLYPSDLRAPFSALQLCRLIRPAFAVGHRNGDVTRFVPTVLYVKGMSRRMTIEDAC